MRLKPASYLVLIRQLKQTVKAKADGKSKENEIKEIPGIQVCACFTVGFTLPLVLTNGLEANPKGALAPLTEQIKIKKIRLKSSRG